MTPSPSSKFGRNKSSAAFLSYYLSPILSTPLITPILARELRAKSSIPSSTTTPIKISQFTALDFRDTIRRIMAKKSNTKRKLVGLVSEESGIRQYYTKKNTMNTPDKLTLRKYDPVLRKHVVFTETKKNLGRNEVKEKKR